MKRSFVFLFLICACLVTLPMSVHAKGFSLTVDGEGLLADSKSMSSGSGAIGFSLFGEYRVGPKVGLGLGAGYLKFGGWDGHVGYVDLAGRLYPFKSLSKGELYLQGGVGANLTKNGEKSWQGNYHANGGVGLRYDLSESGALDFGVIADFFTPTDSPLIALGVKVGYTIKFGSKGKTSSVTSAERSLSADREEAAKTPVKTVVTTAPTPVSTVSVKTASTATEARASAAKKAEETASIKVPSVYKLVAGDQIRALAKRFYGDEAYYPVIVDANAMQLRRPEQLVAGVLLTLPGSMTPGEKADARVKSRQAGYKLWAARTIQ
jgi:hypothetical protein